ncbi:MAG: ATP-binding protein [Candidatus Omnitrophota bacterium]
MRKRYLMPHILKDLDEKMVFVGGARQVGKTSLATYLAKNHFHHYDYLNWDYREDRKRILDSRFEGNAEIILFDEIHKYKDWKNYLKGQFDKHKDDFKILVTGSARLDIYRKGGDSLMGRYYYYRLHPFSIAEFLEKENVITPFSEINFLELANSESYEALKILLKFGGFPEPLLKQSERTLRRWHNQRAERLIREDIRDLENIRDLSALQILIDVLPRKVGSLLSINSLREDLSVAHKTVAGWIDILERFYYHFRIYPFTDSKIRSLKKEPKLYLYDWSEVDDGGSKLENMVASHLLKLCHYLNDVEGHKTEVYFLRDMDGREVDFLITEKGKPWFAVEVKSSAKDISKNLFYFSQRLKIPFSYQVVFEKDVDIRKDTVRIISLDRFLASLV